MPTPSDLRQYAPATQRNKEFILEVLQQFLPPLGTVLEVSSGTGEHASFFAPQLPAHKWLPSDPNPIARDSIAAWRTFVPAPNLYPPIALDASQPIWPVEQSPLPTELAQTDFALRDITAIVNINMIHIAPWSACLGLLAGAGRILPPGGMVYLYGPYKQNGQHTAPSNEQFDLGLRSQNPDWGVRDLADVIQAAEAQRLALVRTVEMPANNLSVMFVSSP
jgi:hypothetical protein